MNLEAGLYIVATPIGNLADMSRRATETLAAVDLIAAEDTRHSRKLLQHLGITTRLTALHEHNEREASDALLTQIGQGGAVALISDAGTPLLSDPGFFLVRAAHEAGIRVTPVPGASAAICALSVAGLPTDRFVFEGFLPARQSARRKHLEQLVRESRTLIFYESSHRILASLTDMKSIFGADRQAVIARELTKTFETIRTGTFENLCDWIDADPDQQRGEFVVLVHGKAAAASDELNADAESLLRCLLEELPVSQAAKLASRISGISKRLLYERALVLKDG